MGYATGAEGVSAETYLAHTCELPVSFNGKLKDELIDREIFYSLREAQVLVEQWRREYNTVRPHSALGYRPPPRPFGRRLGSSRGRRCSDLQIG